MTADQNLNPCRHGDLVTVANSKVAGRAAIAIAPLPSILSNDTAGENPIAPKPSYARLRSHKRTRNSPGIYVKIFGEFA
jgi:hypothetical protein